MLYREGYIDSTFTHAIFHVEVKMGGKAWYGRREPFLLVFKSDHPRMKERSISGTVYCAM